MSTPLEILVRELKAASNAYYNSDKSILTDDEYDSKKEQLEKLVPNHPFLKTIGAPPSASVKQCILPMKMSSLQKIKPETGQVALFSKRTSNKVEWVISDKLDGISILWDYSKKQLYLRGDGIQGVNVSHLIPYIQGLLPDPAKKVLSDIMIRGELMVRNEDCPSNTIPRSWTNGVVHQKTLIVSDARKLRFVAYEVLLPDEIQRSVQLSWLKKLGFEVVWNTKITSINDEKLIELLKERRIECPYTMDGLVVAEDMIPLSQSDDYKNEKTISLPKDVRAFKMTMNDQCATTTVVDVLWGTSNQGYLIPRIQIKPVNIQGATITYLTGHNAQNIKDNNIGPGTTIVVRRSGDVIPTLDHVIKGTAAKFPSADSSSSKWKWDGVHIRLCDESNTNESTILPKLQHFIKTIGVDRLGPGLIVKLVESGITSPKILYETSVDKFKSVLGPNIGETIWTNLHTSLTAVDKEVIFMKASSLMPRTIGERKLDILFALESDIRKWKTRFGASPPQGWSSTSMQELVDSLDSYEKWRKEELPQIRYPLLPAAPGPAAAPVEHKGVLCFTGFRPSPELESQCISKGYQVSDSFTSKTTHLIIPDGDSSETGKVKKAREKHIPILTKTKLNEYLI
jgi:DNA ligase (NAD+)